MHDHSVKRVASYAAAALAARLVFLLAGAKALGVDVLDLALRYDGHVYLRIAKTLPDLYHDGRGPFLTGWFPLYPVLVRMAAFLLRDFRAAAIFVSLMSSVLAVVLFHRLAAKISKRPDLATVLFIFFPPMWLVVGGMSFVEPLLACAAIGGVLGVLESRPRLAGLACVCAVLTQKSGFLVPLILALMLGRRSLSRRWFPALFSSVVAIAALQCYLRIAFGDFFINLRVQREVFGGSLFSIPFSAFLGGLLEPSALGGAWRKAAIASSGLLYLAAAARASRVLRPWLWTVLGFFFCLGGAWAFHSLPRFLLLAAPAAVLALEPLLPRRERLLLVLAPLALLPFFLGLVELAQAEAFWTRAWGPGYAAAASRELR